jgi:hypothetical protein
VLVVSAGVLGACFADVCRREWGSAARNPAIAFACTTPFVSIVSGSYPFTAGAACVALALLALQRGWRVVFSVAVVAALGFSPLAFAVLLSLGLSPSVETVGDAVTGASSGCRAAAS